jgi:hypothetical protein
MNIEDVKKIALITKCKLHEWLVMPFGSKNATNIFSQTMTKIFADWMQKFLKMFVEDLNVHSATWEKHLQHIKMVL